MSLSDMTAVFSIIILGTLQSLRVLRIFLEICLGLVQLPFGWIVTTKEEVSVRIPTYTNSIQRLPHKRCKTKQASPCLWGADPRVRRTSLQCSTRPLISILLVNQIVGEEVEHKLTYTNGDDDVQNLRSCHGIDRRCYQMLYCFAVILCGRRDDAFA